MTAYPYDETYDPAVPHCEVTLIENVTGLQVSLDGIVDTGADGTIIPIRYLRQVGARRVSEVGLRSQWGERRTVFLYLIDLKVGDLILAGTYVVGDELGSEVVIGRNVLNRLRILLDGPNQLMQLFGEAAHRR